MKYEHTLHITDIKTGRIYIPGSELDDDFFTWFKSNLNNSFRLYDIKGRFITNKKICKGKRENSFRISCGGERTFENKIEGDIITIEKTESNKLVLNLNPEIDEKKTRETVKRPKKSYPIKKANKKRKLGEKIDFRGMEHSPINEQGVVLLFGMICKELGFIIEGVQQGYPDCEGKKLLEDGKYIRVRIEFEYKSKNFLQHGHAPEECDLIICWEDDWPKCPLEVIELKEEIKYI